MQPQTGQAASGHVLIDDLGVCKSRRHAQSRQRPTRIRFLDGPAPSGQRWSGSIRSAITGPKFSGKKASMDFVLQEIPG